MNANFLTIAFKTVLLSSVLIFSIPAFSQSFSINSGANVTNQQVLKDQESGTIAEAGKLDVTGIAILQRGAATGVVIVNNGTIKASVRTIDTDNAVRQRHIELYNNGVIDSGNDSFRIRSDVSEGFVLIDNKGMMSSQTGQVLDFADMTSGATQISINNSGIMQALNNDAIILGAGQISIENSGAIIGSRRAINLNENGTISSFDLVNQQSGYIQSIDDAIRIGANPKGIERILITNYGSISTTGTGALAGQGIDLNNAIANSIIIKNYGRIETADADAVRPGQGGIIENWGVITGRSVSADGSSDGIDYQDSNSGTVVNREGGTIIGARHGITGKIPMRIVNEKNALILGQNGSGINYDTTAAADPMEVINYGIIRGAFNLDAVYGDGDGVDVDGSAHIENYGEIYGDGSIGTKVGDPSPATSEAIAIGGGSIINGSAAYRNALISGVDNGILVDDSDTGPAFAAMDIINYGIIEGRSGYGIRIISNDDNSINNYGVIRGTNNYAVIFGDGNDNFIYQNGSSVQGVVDGGNGNNSLTFGEVAGNFDVANIGNNSVYRNFSLVNFAAASHWQFSGTSDFQGSIVVDNSYLTLNKANLDAAHLNIGIDGIVNGSGRIQSLNMNGGQLVIDRSSDNDANFYSNADIILANGARLYVNGDDYNELLNTSGHIAMDGSPILTIDKLGGCYSQGGCTIFSAANGVSGSLTVNGSFAFLEPQLNYQPNAVILNFVRNNKNFSDFTITTNQYETAHAVDSLSSLNPVVKAIAVLNENQVSPAIFDNLSGEIYGATRTSLLINSRYIRDAMTQRMMGHGYNLPHEPVWVSTWGHSGRISGSLNNQKASNDSWGIASGFDGEIRDQLFAGIMLGYEKTNIKDVRNSKSDIDSLHIGAYAMSEINSIHLRGGFAYSYLDATSERHIWVPNLASTARDDYHGWQVQLFAEASKDFTIADKAVITPYANLAQIWLKFDDVHEHGSLARLDIAGRTDSATFTTLGFRSQMTINAMLAFYTDLGWQHGFGDVDGKTINHFANTLNDFTIRAVGLDKDMAMLGTGFSVKINESNSIAFGYKGQIGSNVSDHMGQVTWKIRF
ncbi:autotransporter domain-containing protein [Bartonella sp. HY329]|uniref:autotransporter outer membrane beta-barrel domain-containing protein n=1 Tax=unclassified Bartonella TaxID=2645622 RepID=UPI0021CA4DF1|nr:MULTISPECIES: autotransporter outer membrane beta-barrel domain-containing protein [unclassified Bartonella]UXM95903.1 autotransporter domain-containing protein [Bartonella sp. HY329]UXN10228.1 autotransporter domain-containing protein [Bartonella sp. HY328]